MGITCSKPYLMERYSSSCLIGPKPLLASSSRRCFSHEKQVGILSRMALLETTSASSIAARIVYKDLAADV